MIEGMGELHLEIIVDRLRREFKVECDVGAPQVSNGGWLRGSDGPGINLHAGDLPSLALGAPALAAGLTSHPPVLSSGTPHLPTPLPTPQPPHHTHPHVQVNYREGISRAAEVRYVHKKQSGGSGQFADVAIKFEPGEAGTGFEFRSDIKGGVVPKEYIPGVTKVRRLSLDMPAAACGCVMLSVTCACGSLRQHGAGLVGAVARGSTRPHNAVVEARTAPACAAPGQPPGATRQASPSLRAPRCSIAPRSAVRKHPPPRPPAPPPPPPQGLEEMMSSGSLAGFPVVDVKATLYDGSYHDVDSSVLAFQVRGLGAARAACAAGAPDTSAPPGVRA